MTLYKGGKKKIDNYETEVIIDTPISKQHTQQL